MNPRLARVAVLALLGVLAVAAAAATLPSAQPVQSGDGGAGGTGAGQGQGQGQGNGQGSGGVTLPAWLERALSALGEVLAVLVALAALAVVLSALYGLLRDPRALLDALERLPTVLLALLAFFGVLALGVLLIQLLPALGDGAAARPRIGQLPTSGGGGSEATSAVDTGTLILVALALAAALGVVWLRRRLARRATPLASEGEAPAAEAVRRAAGRAADDVDEADGEAAVENAVYRAWREMTELLDAGERRVATPGQFARAAVDAGFDPAAVDDLTRVFEDVRYGEVEATAGRRRRAAAALRRIEADVAERGEAERVDGSAGRTSGGASDSVGGDGKGNGSGDGSVRR